MPVPLRKCPRQESNLRTRFRKPLLYPLSYGGGAGVSVEPKKRASPATAGAATGEARSAQEASASDVVQTLRP